MNNECFHDVVTCSKCGFTGFNLALTRCECGAVLGEQRLTHKEISARWFAFATRAQTGA